MTDLLDNFTFSPTVAPLANDDAVGGNGSGELVQSTDTVIIQETFYVYGTIYLVLFTVFCIGRRQYNKYYNLRSWVPELYSDLAVRQSKKYGSSYVSWCWKVFRVTDDELLEECGMDALCLLRCLRMGTKLCCFGAFNSLWLIPTFLTAESSGETNYLTDPFVRMSIANLPSASARFAGPVLATYLTILYGLRQVHKEYAWFIEYRHKFMRRRMPRNYTVYVSSVPKKFQSSYGLTDYFSQNSAWNAARIVVESHIAMDIPSLEAKVARRETVIKKLEYALALKQKKGITATHRSINVATGFDAIEKTANNIIRTATSRNAEAHSEPNESPRSGRRKTKSAKFLEAVESIVAFRDELNTLNREIAILIRRIQQYQNQMRASVTRKSMLLSSKSCAQLATRLKHGPSAQRHLTIDKDDDSAEGTGGYVPAGPDLQHKLLQDIEMGRHDHCTEKHQPASLSVGGHEPERVDFARCLDPPPLLTTNTNEEEPDIVVEKGDTRMVDPMEMPENVEAAASDHIALCAIKKNDNDTELGVSCDDMRNVNASEHLNADQAVSEAQRPDSDNSSDSDSEMLACFGGQASSAVASLMSSGSQFLQSSASGTTFDTSRSFHTAHQRIKDIPERMSFSQQPLSEKHDQLFCDDASNDHEPIDARINRIAINRNSTFNTDTTSYGGGSGSSITSSDHDRGDETTAAEPRKAIGHPNRNSCDSSNLTEPDRMSPADPADIMAAHNIGDGEQDEEEIVFSSAQEFSVPSDAAVCDPTGKQAEGKDRSSETNKARSLPNLKSSSLEADGFAPTDAKNKRSVSFHDVVTARSPMPSFKPDCARSRLSRSNNDRSESGSAHTAKGPSFQQFGSTASAVCHKPIRHVSAAASATKTVVGTTLHKSAGVARHIAASGSNVVKKSTKHVISSGSKVVSTTTGQVATKLKQVGNNVETGANILKDSAAAIAPILRRTGNGEPRTAGFVTFRDLYTTHAAIQMLQYPSPNKMLIEPAPAPEEVLWPSIGMPDKAKQTGMILSSASTVMLCFFWSIPTTFLSSLTEVNSLKESFPALGRAVENYPLLENTLALLAPLCLLILNESLLPSVLEYFSAWEGHIGRPTLLSATFNKLATFMLIQTFFISTVSGTISAELANILDNPGDIVDLLANSLPAQSSYFIQISFVFTFTIHGLELIRALPLGMAIVRYFVGPKLTKKQRRTSYYFINSLEDPPEFRHAETTAQLVLFFVVFFVYTPIAPITSIFLMFCFLICESGYRYNFIHNHKTSPDSGGKIWRGLINVYFISMFIGVLTLMGYLLLRDTLYAIPALVPLLVIIGLYILLIVPKKLHVASNLPTQLCVETDRMHERNQESMEFVRDKYLQPALKHPAMYPDDPELDFNELDAEYDETEVRSHEITRNDR